MGINGHMVTVHPRVCGEQSSVVISVFCTIGSSPRVRGTAVSAPLVTKGLRFIPACAGNRSQSRGLIMLLSVHPRVCGEQITVLCDEAPYYGSSPRVRGTVPTRLTQSKPRRFIPACAGNSAPHPVKYFQKTVHPRVCGEQVSRQRPGFRYAGSSPRVRGTGLEPCLAA